MLTISCAFGESLLEVRVESSRETFEVMVSTGVERGEELENEGLGLICEPESCRMWSEEELCADCLRELNSDPVRFSDGSGGEEILVSDKTDTGFWVTESDAANAEDGGTSTELGENEPDSFEVETRDGFSL